MTRPTNGIPANSGPLNSQNAGGYVSLLFPLLVSVVMAIFSMAWHHGGSLHPEVEDRLPYYLSHGPLLPKIYDSDYLDWGMYQARELSYFFDYIDCKFIAWGEALGHPHFLSLTQYVFLILISLVLWRFSVTDLKLEPWIALGFLLLFWTSPAVFLGGVFFRTAKIGVALTVVVLFWLLFRILRKAREIPGYSLSTSWWWIFFSLAWAATLFDRQGVFMLGDIIVFLGFWLWGYREKNTLKLLSAFVAAFALSFIYNYIIAPLLTLWLNNYWPDFHYQHLPWSNLAGRPMFYLTSGISLYLDAVRFLFGNIPAWGAAIMVFGLFCWALGTGARRRERKPFFIATLGLFATQTVLMWIMIVLMLLRHPALLWPELRGGGYYLPMDSMLTMTLLLGLSLLPARPVWSRWVLALFLGAAVLGNIIALPKHDAFAKAGHMSGNMRGFNGHYPSGPELLEALRQLHNPHYIVPPEVAQNRVYQFFHEGYFSKKPAPLPAKRDPKSK